MRCFVSKQFLVVLAISLLLGAGDDESTRALANWQGKWTLVSSEVNGESATELPNPPSLRVSNT